ncbi:hypothetical protein BDN71DRAFT_461227 [Pleurotus eryngii]|uniref:Transmembrane protein n=1 Tax=Pleurotus eryngii TaxID=5323 RepID=A0A9P6DA76_PLEER|nr:hypothetical protein BDN71DRAFT_461227 [Pleurotus eryngii]
MQKWREAGLSLPRTHARARRSIRFRGVAAHDGHEYRVQRRLSVILLALSSSSHCHPPHTPRLRLIHLPSPSSPSSVLICSFGAVVVCFPLSFPWYVFLPPIPSPSLGSLCSSSSSSSADTPFFPFVR